MWWLLIQCSLLYIYCAVRIGAIYILSALTGGLVAALFLQDRPSVASSAALFGLLGATLSGLILNWKVYSKKVLNGSICIYFFADHIFLAQTNGLSSANVQFATLIVFVTIFMLNFILGLMPLVNNFSNIGGLISGFIAGFMLLFKPQARKVHQNKRGIFDYDIKHSVELERKLDRPISRLVSLGILSLLCVSEPVFHFLLWLTWNLLIIPLLYAELLEWLSPFFNAQIWTNTVAGASTLIVSHQNGGAAVTKPWNVR